MVSFRICKRGKKVLRSYIREIGRAKVLHKGDREGGGGECFKVLHTLYIVSTDL